MERLNHPGTWIRFLAKNAGVPLLFWITFQLAGAKPAIGFAVVATGLQLAAQILLRSPISPIFLVASVYTIGFGLIDVIIAHPHFFRLEPSIQSLTIGSVFLVSAALGHPLLAWFERALPEGLRKDAALLGRKYYVRATAVWGLYFVVKAGVFLRASLIFPLDRFILFRAVFGGSTLALMVGCEVWIRKRKYRRINGSRRSHPVRRTGRSPSVGSSGPRHPGHPGSWRQKPPDRRPGA